MSAADVETLPAVSRTWTQAVFVPSPVVRVHVRAEPAVSHALQAEPSWPKRISATLADIGPLLAGRIEKEMHSPPRRSITQRMGDRVGEARHG